MLKVKVIVVDRTRSPFLREGESFYLKRIDRYIQFNWVEVKPSKAIKGKPVAQILAQEGQNIEKKLMPRDYLVALDRSGKPCGSRELAAWLDQLSDQAGRWISFIIGGPLGLSADILKRADRVLSLSKLTLTHEMSRLILLEQLYRAMTILRGESYHK